MLIETIKNKKIKRSSNRKINKNKQHLVKAKTSIK